MNGVAGESIAIGSTKEQRIPVVRETVVVNVVEVGVDKRECTIRVGDDGVLSDHTVTGVAQIDSTLLDTAHRHRWAIQKNAVLGYDA